MDNYIIHLSDKLRQIYSKNKVKVLIIVPYLSEFDALNSF